MFWIPSSVNVFSYIKMTIFEPTFEASPCIILNILLSFSFETNNVILYSSNNDAESNFGHKYNQGLSVLLYVLSKSHVLLYSVNTLFWPTSGSCRSKAPPKISSQNFLYAFSCLINALQTTST